MRALIVLLMLCLSGCDTRPADESLVKKDPARAKICIDTAREALVLKHYDEAAKSGAEAIDLDPTQYIAYLYRGYAYYKSSHPAQSILDFNAAIRLGPNNYQGYEYRAAAYQTIKRYRKAIADYTKCIALASADNVALKAKLYRELGMCLLSFGELAEARSALGNAIALLPDEPTAYAGRATAELHLADLDASLEDANNAVALNPQSAEAHQVRSRVFAALGKAKLSDDDEKLARELFARELNTDTGLSR
jgi:tetratricopeptide (TPR) repeat protein